ncbi:hypothetical protein HMPREF3038_03147 [Akkermansia sp. KLE1797]|nr:hypothetical protein HMPREF3038_03147 [Akkermansia sp. KLE1797]
MDTVTIQSFGNLPPYLFLFYFTFLKIRLRDFFKKNHLPASCLRRGFSPWHPVFPERPNAVRRPLRKSRYGTRRRRCFLQEN